MRAKVSWGQNADEMGFAQPHNIFNLFNGIVGNDDFPIKTSTDRALVVEGQLGFAGFPLDLRMTIKGVGFTYQGDEVTGGEIRHIKVEQLTDDGETAKIFNMRGLRIDVTDLTEAMEFEDNGGFDGTVEELLYGNGWVYNGVPSVDVIDPDQMFFGYGTQFNMDGRDKIFGRAGDDTILSGEGRDFVSGGNGNDFIRGGLGKDTLKGGRGDDEIYGDVGYWDGRRDKIFGGGGDDYIEAGAGNDRVNGGRGNDKMVDAAGRDTFVFGKRSGHDWIHDTDNNGADLIIRTGKEITVTFINMEAAFSSGPWAGEYFDRGFLLEWGRNSLLLGTYGDIEDFGLTDYTML